MDRVVGLREKQSEQKKITFFQLCSIRKRNGSQARLSSLAVPRLCWPLQAKVKTLKQTVSDTFLLVKVLTACAVSPQHSSLLVASRRCAGDVLSPVLLYWLGWQECLHIRQWELGRMMFSLVNLAP